MKIIKKIDGTRFRLWIIRAVFGVAFITPTTTSPLKPESSTPPNIFIPFFIESPLLSHKRPTYHLELQKLNQKQKISQ